MAEIDEKISILLEYVNIACHAARIGAWIRDDITGKTGQLSVYAHDAAGRDAQGISHDPQVGTTIGFHLLSAELAAAVRGIQEAATATVRANVAATVYVNTEQRGARAARAAWRSLIEADKKNCDTFSAIYTVVRLDSCITELLEVDLTKFCHVGRAFWLYSLLWILPDTAITKKHIINYGYHGIIFDDVIDHPERALRRYIPMLVNPLISIVFAYSIRKPERADVLSRILLLEY